MPEARSSDGPNCLTTPRSKPSRKIYAGPINPRTNETDLVAALSRQRAGLEFLHGLARPHRHRDGSAARRDSRAIRPGTTGRRRRFRPPRRAGRSVGHRARERVEPGHLGIRPAGRKTDSLGRLEQRPGAGGRRPRLLQRASRATIGAREHRSDAVRLYMVPGMIECNGGPGTDTFDMLGVMRRLGRARSGAERGDRVARRARQSRADTAALSRIRRWRRTKAAAARTRQAISCVRTEG